MTDFARLLTDRKMLDAAEQMIREVASKEDDRITGRVRAISYQGTEGFPYPEYMVFVGGREVTEDGNVIDTEARSRGVEAKRFSGPVGLVGAWMLIDELEKRAANLGVKIDVTVKVRWSQTIQSDWVAWTGTTVVVS